MSFTKLSRPTATITKLARPRSAKAAIYSVARFGQARYGNSDGYTRVARPAATITKIARPHP